MSHAAPPVDGAHREPLHAAKLDHDGKRLATASADHRVRVWDVKPNVHCFPVELHGHQGAVWDVAWSHPRFGPVLASAGEDNRVLVWHQLEGDWCQVYSHEVPGLAIAVQFCPWEYGLQLAVACCDGQVFVLSRRNDRRGDEGTGTTDSEAEESVNSFWREEKFRAHEGGTFAVCWAPAVSSTVQTSSDSPVCRLALAPRRIVTGGADKQVRIWRHDIQTDAWVDQYHFPSGEHSDWVRDVAWRPNVGIPENIIASCAEDGTVRIWRQATDGQPWTRQAAWQLSASAWQLAWSATGSIVAATTSKNEVKFYQETASGSWEEVIP